jgi:hypothetical protein
MTMKNAIFWDVMLYDSCKNRHFGETSVLMKATQCHIPEDGILHLFNNVPIQNSLKLCNALSPLP